jgi:hypothetical protein
MIYCILCKYMKKDQSVALLAVFYECRTVHTLEGTSLLAKVIYKD